MSDLWLEIGPCPLLLEHTEVGHTANVHSQIQQEGEEVRESHWLSSSYHILLREKENHTKDCKAFQFSCNLELIK